MRPYKYYKKLGKGIGKVTQTAGSIVYAEGLTDVSLEEMVIFKNNELGQIISLNEIYAEILTFENKSIKPGTEVIGTGKDFEISLTTDLLGKTVDSFAKAFDPEKKMQKGLKKEKIEKVPSGITERQTIKKPLETGVALVDLLIPLGRGQRELVIGDRKTGKSSFLLQASKSAVKQGMICVYAAIGKKRMDIKGVEEFFQSKKIAAQTVLVASSSEDAPGVIFMTPYTAMTIAEYFRDKGKDVLVILDDLSTHAKFYREISLLGRRFPGRNSYPADIFYVHSRLLERAGNFKTDTGEFSITCLPVVETLQGDLSGYIQTNIMSMTDGHIYFDSNLFAQGRRPAINPFLSVTRVGKQTQTDTKRYINRELLSFLTLYEKMQSFTHFGAEITDNSKAIIATGKKLSMLLDQDTSIVIPGNLQTMMFGLLWTQIVKTDNDEALQKFKAEMVKYYEGNPSYRTVIDTLVGESKTFNELLLKIRENRAKIINENAN